MLLQQQPTINRFQIITLKSSHSVQYAIRPQNHAAHCWSQGSWALWFLGEALPWQAHFISMSRTCVLTNNQALPPALQLHVLMQA
jgi:hypothetical protein